MPDESPRRTATWEEFSATVAAIARVEPASIKPGTRLVEDLALDSITLAELVFVLTTDYDMTSLSRALDTRHWRGVGVRDLYDEYLTGTPVGMNSPVSSTGPRDPR